METKDFPHGVVGFNFAQALLVGDYEMAHGMLSAELKVEYPSADLKRQFEAMMSNADQPSEAPEIEVLDNSGLGDGSGGSEGAAYVAIWSEAVAVTVKPLGPGYLITELVWGRP
jgi:hypothetical protein